MLRTELRIDDRHLIYFNQREDWQRLEWPSESYRPKASLGWHTDETGLRLYDDYSGNMALIRLLERARVEQLDNSRYLLQWIAEDGHHLNYVLRTEVGQGPLELLRLRNFRLPDKVFEPVVT